MAILAFLTRKDVDETLIEIKTRSNKDQAETAEKEIKRVEEFVNITEQIKKEKVKYKIGKFPFLANSRAKVNNETEGFVKIIADEKTDKVLGVSIINALAGTMIAEVAIAMEFGASAEDIARTCHAHPTHSEAVKEAAMAVDKRPIHF